MVAPTRVVGGVTSELRYVGTRVGVGICTIRFLLCLPLQVFQLNERTPQLFVVSSENVARTFCPVWIVLNGSDGSGLVLNPSPETSHVLLHSLQLKERRHMRPPEPAFGDAHACHIGDRARARGAQAG